MLERILESLLDYKEIKTINPKGNQPWVLIGAIDAGAEALIFWPPDVKNGLIGKDPDAGKDKVGGERLTETGVVGRHPRLDRHEFEQALGVGDGQWSPACWSPWGCRKSDTTEQLNWTDWIPISQSLLYPYCPYIWSLHLCLFSDAFPCEFTSSSLSIKARSTTLLLLFEKFPPLRKEHAYAISLAQHIWDSCKFL